MLKTLLVIVGVCGMLIYTIPTYAQSVPSSLVFGKNHITFKTGYLKNIVSQNGIINQKGTFEALSLNGGFFGLGLISNPYPNLGLEVGFNFSVQNVGYQLNLKAEEFQMMENVEFSDFVPELYLEIPLLIHPRIQLSPKNWLEGHVGLTMNFYMPSQVSYDINEATEVKTEDLIDIRVNFPGRNPYWSGILGVGWQHLTKGYNLFGIHLTGAYGFKNVLHGDYLIWDRNAIVGAGNFTSRGSYWSLAISYTFTGNKITLQKIKAFKD